MELKGVPFVKGHGTGNDFVLVPDPEGELHLGPRVIAAVCDRRFGIGGDGLLRVVRTAAVPQLADRASEAEWFMDYHNADGSLADLCGNGVRVFARYLVESGLAAGPSLPILTRAGRLVAEVAGDEVAVEMPGPAVLGSSWVQISSGTELEGSVVTCGNPNLVCWVADPDELDLTVPLVTDRVRLPAGANVEFVAPAAGDGLAVRMRVVERGVGETLSCGSGACAVAAVVLRDSGSSEGEVVVDVPGGRLRVKIDTQQCVLTGPAVIVAAGTLVLPD